MNVSANSTKTKLEVDDNARNTCVGVGVVKKENIKRMVRDLETHLQYLNRNLLNQKLMNKRLSTIKEQMSTENSIILY